MGDHWVFQHGWGFDATCWQAWMPIVPSQCEISLLDRGYFGNKVELHGSPDVVVTHSFGLHLMPPEIYAQTKVLIILGGFLHLHPKEEGKRSKVYLTWLKKSLKSNPATALEQFYKDCGYSAAVPNSTNVSLLIEDLERLNHNVFDYTLIKSIPEITIFHGMHDKISKVEKAIELHSFLPHSRLVTFEKANHALPFTHALLCMEDVYGKHLLRGSTNRTDH